jgi:hypothetical protein
MYERRWDHKKLISEEILFEKYFEEETSGEKSF